MGAPSVPPGRYFRMHLVGYFEGIDSERGLEWRCSDSLSLRAFLRLGSRDRVPDHSWLSRSRTRLPHEVHAAVFNWVLVLIAEAGLIKGERIGRRSSTMEANAALRNIVGATTAKATGRCWSAWPGKASRHPRPRSWRVWSLKRQAAAKLSNTDWVSKSDPEAKIAKMKDGTRIWPRSPSTRWIWTPARWWRPSCTRPMRVPTTLSKTLAKAEANLEAVDAAPTRRRTRPNASPTKVITHGRS